MYFKKLALFYLNLNLYIYYFIIINFFYKKFKIFFNNNIIINKINYLEF